MHDLVERLYRDLAVTQDLGLGMILWMSHFFPGATCSKVLRERSLATLGRMWIDPPATSVGGQACLPSSSHSRTTACRLDCRRFEPGPSGSMRGSSSLRPTAHMIGMTAMRSRT